jgi:hypothetical protein
MIIKPSRKFEGSIDTMKEWLEFVAARSWEPSESRKSVTAVFFRAAHLGIEKKTAVVTLQKWLLEHTEAFGEHASLMGFANIPFREVAKKNEGGSQCR